MLQQFKKVMIAIYFFKGWFYKKVFQNVDGRKERHYTKDSIIIYLPIRVNAKPNNIPAK